MKFLSKLFGNSKRRSEYYQILASQINLPYYSKNETGITKQLSDFGLFNFGHSQTITNVIQENALLYSNFLFDFQYVVSTGKSSVQFNQTVFFVNSKELSLPHFVQKPETFFTKLIAYLGFEDIDFKDFPAYSEKFNLKGEYEEVIRFYFSEDLLQLLSNQNAFNMEAMNYYFILYHQNKLVEEQDLRSFRNLGLMLFNLFLVQSKKSDNFLQ